MRNFHKAWITDLKAIALNAKTADELFNGLLDWQKDQGTPDYTEGLGDALAIMDLVGRSDVLNELDDTGFADPSIGTLTFKEAQEFLRQKVSLPSKVWTETLHQAHDRAFVVAGADSVALVEDLRKALDRAINEGGGLNAFRQSFDEIIERTGWDYNGGRNWRTRVIYDTNLRTAHQAGRLKQMRDPDVVKQRPYWKYVHAETREPKQPRDEHVALDGMVFAWDDPIWDFIFPPNGWKCSCGVITVSRAGLKRLGKTGPDKAPKLKMRKHRDPTTGDMVSVPEGIDFGWGYQPGHTWENGLVPREWQKPLSIVQPDLPLPVVPPLGDLGRSFASSKLPAGKKPEFYVSSFLQRFGATIELARMFRDKAGQAVLISSDLFKTGDGRWKVLKFGRATEIDQLAEAIFDPDEIWTDWAELPDGSRRLVRRYLRWDTKTATFSAFEWGVKGWSGVTSFTPTRGRKQNPDLNYLEKHRRGALIYRRSN